MREKFLSFLFRLLLSSVSLLRPDLFAIDCVFWSVIELFVIDIVYIIIVRLFVCGLF